MLDYGALAGLAAVIREGSFDKAAASLNVTPSAVSQRVKLLEERVGSVLVNRGQPCTATEQGRLLCRHYEQVLLMEGELAAVLPHHSDDGEGRGRVTLPVAVNADSLDSWFLDAVADFTGQTGHLIDIKVDDQDHTADWLKRGEVLAAVTAEAKPVQGCRVTAIGALTYAATASPSFVSRYFPAGVTAAALSNAPSLTFNRKDQLQRQWVDQVVGRDCACPTHWLPSTYGFLTAALLGVGWGMNPERLADEHLRAGSLVELIPGSRISVPLYWQAGRLSANLIAPLTVAVVRQGRRWLRQD